MRRSVAGQPLSKHRLGDGRSIRHGSDCGETQVGNKKLLLVSLDINLLKTYLVKLFHLTVQVT